MLARAVRKAWKRVVDEPRLLLPIAVWVVVLYYTRLTSEIEPFISRALGFPPTVPSADPPWYFIRSDFVEGVAASAGLVALLVAAFAVWPLSRMYAWMLVWMNLMFHGGRLMQSAIIYLRCPHFLSPTHAVSAWPTFDDYLSDPVIEIA